MIECFFDGAFRSIGKHRGGHAGCGFVVYDNGRPIHKRFAYIGNDPQLTCNSAEYAGVILVLRYLLEHGISEAVVYGDSLSAIQQLTRNGRLQLDLYPPHHKGAYYQEAWLLRQKASEG